MAVAKKTRNVKKAKRLILSHLAISTALIFVIAGGIAAFLYIKHVQHQHQLEQARLAEQKYQAELTQYKTINNQYFDVFRSYASLPSTTTKTQSGWDDYYDGLISQLSTVKTTLNSKAITDNRLIPTYNLLTNAVDDLNNELTLSKSISDMQFQVSSDQSKLSSDESTLSGEESIYNNADGLISNSYVTEFQTAVSNDKTQLATDQQTYKSQQDQSTALTQTVIQDSLAVTKSANGLGL